MNTASNISYPYFSLGLTARGKRPLQSITPYLKYFGTPKYNDKFLDGKKPKDTHQVLRQIAKIIRECTPQTAAFARAVIGGANTKTTCKKLYDWLYKHIQYTEDENGIEQLREPIRTVADAVHGVDCDCYSIFISCVLHNLHIPHNLRVIELDEKGYYQHIYVIVPLSTNADLSPYHYPQDHIVIDPVMDTFNKEPEHITHYFDYVMLPVQRLDGLNRSHKHIGKAMKGGHLGAITTANTSHQLISLRKKISADHNLWSAKGYDVVNTIKAIDYLLTYWNTPYRKQAIEVVAYQQHLILPASLGAVDMNALTNNLSSGGVVSPTSITNPNQLPPPGESLAKAGVQAATGDYVGAAISAAKAAFASAKWKDVRPGERQKDGWGKRQPNIPFKFKLWGDVWEFTNEWNDDRLSKGYWLKRAGQKWDVAKYLWFANGRLYKQAYLAPWEDQWKAGAIVSWGSTHQRGGSDSVNLGQGAEPQPLHMSGLDIIEIEGLTPSAWLQKQGVKTSPAANPQSTIDINQVQFPPGTTINPGGSTNLLKNSNPFSNGSGVQAYVPGSTTNVSTNTGNDTKPKTSGAATYIGIGLGVAALAAAAYYAANRAKKNKKAA